MTNMAFALLLVGRCCFFFAAGLASGSFLATTAALLAAGLLSKVGVLEGEATGFIIRGADLVFGVQVLSPS